jgi:AhpD family alkylhydroperoxidase
MSENILNDKTRSLIAVGASIAANCQPCLKHHLAKAQELGINSQEILEAIEVGKAVRTGAAGSMDKLVAEMKRNDLNLCASSGDAQGCCCN